MRFTINIDCTPEEARAFLGLPDLSPVHAAYVDRMQGFVRDGLTPADMEGMMRAWLPAMTQGFDQMRQAFWSAATTATAKDG
jgi:hypothetical protein